MSEILEASTLVIEYAAIRDPENWSESPPYSHLNQAQALIAARMGSVRLIDNMRSHAAPRRDHRNFAEQSRR